MKYLPVIRSLANLRTTPAVFPPMYQTPMVARILWIADAFGRFARVHTKNLTGFSFSTAKTANHANQRRQVWVKASSRISVCSRKVYAHDFLPSWISPFSPFSSPFVSVLRERRGISHPHPLPRRRRPFFFFTARDNPTITPFETLSLVNVFSSSWIQANAILHSSG